VTKTSIVRVKARSMSGLSSTSSPLVAEPASFLLIVVFGNGRGSEKAPDIRVCEISPIGAPGTIRTSDPQIRSLMLYPAELRARIGKRRVRGDSQKVQARCGIDLHCVGRSL
jgi:hypothetical protein